MRLQSSSERDSPNLPTHTCCNQYWMKDIYLQFQLIVVNKNHCHSFGTKCKRKEDSFHTIGNDHSKWTEQEKCNSATVSFLFLNQIAWLSELSLPQLEITRAHWATAFLDFGVFHRPMASNCRAKWTHSSP
jgi:hypothetical protein